MDWLNQDVVIEKIQSKISNLRNAAHIAEKGKEVMTQKSKEEIIKYAEFSVRAEDYIRQADFLEEILLDINCLKEEELKQLEEAEQDLREKRVDAYI